MNFIIVLTLIMVIEITVEVLVIAIAISIMLVLGMTNKIIFVIAAIRGVSVGIKVKELMLVSFAIMTILVKIIVITNAKVGYLFLFISNYSMINCLQGANRY